MTEEKVLANATLLFPVSLHAVCMGIKKKKIGAGLLNGVGGGIEPDEDEKLCAVREAQEEWLFTPRSLDKRAIIDFHNRRSGGDVFTCRVHIFFAYMWDHNPQETEEMGTPEWVSRDNPPLERMMLADRAWIPLVFAGKQVVGEAWYGPHQATLEREPLIHIATDEEMHRLRYQP